MKHPITPAIRVLRKAEAKFEPFLYRYEPKGGTSSSAKALGVGEHQLVKTLMMEDEQGKALARKIGVKTIRACQPQVAQKHSGYQVGGTSPFGTRTKMAIYMEQTILQLPYIFINGGKRGFLVRVEPQTLVTLLQPKIVSVGI